MGNYSKVIGSVVGAVLGFAVSKFGFPADFATPEVVAGVTALFSAIATYFFPQNTPAPTA
jgi:high-affinity Fe2+/Pb2+ permease